MYLKTEEISCGVLFAMDFATRGTAESWVKIFIQSYKEYHTKGQDGDYYWGSVNITDMPYEQVVFSNKVSPTYTEFLELLEEHGKVIKTPVTFNANHPERKEPTIQSAFFIPGAKLKRETQAIIDKAKKEQEDEDNE
jgi:hypothetical protein